MSDIKEFENKMSKTVDALKEDYVTIRAGSAKAVAVKFGTVLQNDFSVTLANHTFCVPFPLDSFCSN